MNKKSNDYKGDDEIHLYASETFPKYVYLGIELQ